MPTLLFQEVPKTLVGNPGNPAGFGFILENLQTYQRSLQKNDEQSRLKRTTEILQSIVVPSAEVRRSFAASVHYDLDLSNSHSSLMLEGIFLKFTTPFFK